MFTVSYTSWQSLWTVIYFFLNQENPIWCAHFIVYSSTKRMRTATLKMKMIVTSTSWPTCPYKGTTFKSSIITGPCPYKGTTSEGSIITGPHPYEVTSSESFIITGQCPYEVTTDSSEGAGTAGPCALFSEWFLVSSTVSRCTSLDHFKPLSVQFGANYCDINFVQYNLECCVRWMLFALHFWGNSTHVGVAISVFQSANWILMLCLAEIHFLFNILFF